MDPRYIVLDEPTSSLDPAGKGKVFAMMTALKSRGITIIHATHAMEEAAIADRLVVMDKGRIVADGAPSSIFSRVEWLKDLGLAPPPIAEILWRLRGKGVAIDPGVFTMEEAVEALHGLTGRSDGRVSAAQAGASRPLRTGPPIETGTHE
jgi:biotin transport system ATP-binding protein/energy-coupling factor transport system ATP-binding protein